MPDALEGAVPKIPADPLGEPGVSESAPDGEPSGEPFGASSPREGGKLEVGLAEEGARSSRAPSSVSPRTLSFIEDPARSQSFSGRLLDIDADAELQCIVEAAASGTGFPMAAVSLVLKHTQIFRAHVGLPLELGASGPIERGSFFCQFVVDRNEPFHLRDALEHPDVPSDVVKRHGLRAYVGLPLRMQGRALGALCVIDTQPRGISDSELDKLERLAGLASRRLAELSGKAPTPGHLISHAAEPAFAEIRNLLSSIVANTAYGRMVVTELEPLLSRLVGASSKVTSGAMPEELKRALASVSHAVDAHRELTIAFAELDGVSKKLIDTVGSLEKTVAARSSYAHSIAESVEAATLAAHHFTKLIGGVRWKPLPPVATHQRAPSWTGLVVSIALQELAARIGPSNQDGIDGSIEVSGSSLVIALGAPRLTEAECSEIVGDLSFLLNGVSLLDVSAEGRSIQLRL